MQAPIVWIKRERRPRLVHRFEGATPHSPVVVLSSDPVEAAELAQAMQERQRQRLQAGGTAFSERLEGRRPGWRR